MIGGRLRFQRRAEDVADAFRGNDLELLPNVFGNFFDIGLFLSGKDDPPDPRTVRGENLFLDAANRKH